MRVLVVDDILLQHHTLAMALQAQMAVVDTAADGLWST
jgi:DNA-binding response OmpR family regulator